MESASSPASPHSSAEPSTLPPDATQSARATRRVKRGWMNLRITEIIEETHDTKTFRLIDDEEGGQAFDYTPGQYLTFRYDSLGTKPVVRSYTMSSAPQDGNFAAVTVKRVAGGLVSNWMCDTLRVGDVLRARGPIGRFVYEQAKDPSHLFFVAGGSGVTPFFSMLKEYSQTLGEPGSPASMSLLVSHRTASDLIFQRDLWVLAENPCIRVFVTFTRGGPEAHAFASHSGSSLKEAPPNLRILHGRIDQAMLSAALNEAGHPLADTTFFTCGPVPMMEMVQSHLLQKGARSGQIKLESFESN
jgi:ferredoxin-NADP reductase